MERLMITFDGLVKCYEGKDVVGNAVDGISASIPEGRLITLLGPSGCGKTTTLRMLAGLERPTGGEIRIGGEVMYSAEDGVLVPPNRRPVGMVFQSYAIWPHMTVFENVAYPLQVQKDKPAKAVIRERTERALETVGLAELASRPATRLSGGQQQRAALARALVKEPKVLLLDEPLSNLDAQLRTRMREWIREVQERSGLTTVYVTHDQDEALAISDAILVMHGGKIVESGAPEDIYRRPRNCFTAGFVGAANEFEGVVDAVTADGVTTVTTAQGTLECRSADSLVPGSPVTVFVRPEDLALSRAPNGERTWSGRVTRRLFQGAYWEYSIAVADRHLRVRAFAELEGLAQGDPAYVTPDRDGVIVVAADDERSDIVGPRTT
jgi:iron(III) transport system ATP-binding protein